MKTRILFLTLVLAVLAGSATAAVDNDLGIKSATDASVRLVGE